MMRETEHGGRKGALAARGSARAREPEQHPDLVRPWTPADADHTPPHQLKTAPLPGPADGAPSRRPTATQAPSLWTFSESIDRLIPAVTGALARLRDIERAGLAPGAFYETHHLTARVLGSASPDEQGGLLPGYQKILADLLNGLVNIQRAISEINHQYPSTEALNDMTAAEVKDALASAWAVFDRMAQADTTAVAPGHPVPRPPGSS